MTNCFRKSINPIFASHDNCRLGSHLLMFFDSYIIANNMDQDQTAPPLIRVFTFIVKVRKETTVRNRYNQTPDPGHHIVKGKKNTRKYHTQKSQEVIPFLAGDHKAARNRQYDMTNIKHK